MCAKPVQGFEGSLLLVLLSALLFLSTPALADISVRATLHPQRAQVGEPLTLSIDISGAQDVPAPALGTINGFDVRYVGPSTQISIVNGQMSASVQHRYSLLPIQAGHFTLGPFTIAYQGKQYQTPAFAVAVVAAGQAAPPQAQPGRAPQGSAAASGQALRLALSVPQTEVYLHERVPVDITLYVGTVRVGDVQYPTLPGDGLSIDTFAEPSQRQQVIDGQTYQVLHFQTTIVPLRAGTLTLGPAALQLNVYSRRRDSMFNDPFFDAFNTDRRPLDLRSDPVALTVLPLPDEGKPASFSGAVGAFTLDVTAAPAQLTAGDPITVRMNVTGSGNLADAAPPELSSIEGFRTYEPRAAKADGASATRSFEQVLIPNDATVRAIPPVHFSFFDPRARRYQTLESQPIALVVRPPQNVPRAQVVAGTPGARVAPEEKLGRDIVYIKDDPGGLVARAAPWSGRVVFLLWQPLPPLLFAAAVWYDRRRQRLSGDIRYARFTRAGKHARHGLAAAQQALAHGNRGQFYDAVSRTMQEYLGAKLDLPPGAIDADAVSRGGVSPDAAERIRTLFATCEQVRFAPGAGDGDMRGTLALAQAIIKQLERERRFAVPSLAAGVLVLLAIGLGVAPAADAPPASPQTTFFHANALYKDAQYDVAARQYEQLLQAGVASGNLYFNLGNAYVKAGERGRAILNYERARRFIPGDPDLQANLAYAQSLTGAEPCAPAIWQRLVFPLAQRMATLRLAWVASALYTLLFLALAAYRLWSQRPRWLVYAAWATGLGVLIATSSLARQVLADDWQQRAVIIDSSETPARFEPAENGTVHFALKEGALVRILDRREGWLQIARCDGRRGWVRAAAAASL